MSDNIDWNQHIVLMTGSGEWRIWAPSALVTDPDIVVVRTAWSRIDPEIRHASEHLGFRLKQSGVYTVIRITNDQHRTALALRHELSNIHDMITQF